MVIPAGDVPSPTEVDVTTSDASIEVSWAKTDTTKVIFTRVQVFSKYGSFKDVYDIASGTSVVIDSLEIGQFYRIEVLNVSNDYQYGETIEISDILVKNANGQNAPMLLNPQEVYEFKEGEIRGFSLKATDLEHDAIQYSIVENLPKTMALINDSIVWCPVVGDAGQYDFHLVLSDGVNTDTIPLKFYVLEVMQQDVRIEFP